MTISTSAASHGCALSWLTACRVPLGPVGTVGVGKLVTVETTSVAQTNLKLYSQLRLARWSTADIEAVGRGYDLAAFLLAGQYRASRKPAVDHFAGVASVAALGGLRPVLVRAAVLHNVYRLGQWGDGFPRVTARRRAEVRAAVGDEAEGVIARYDQFGWSDEVVARTIAVPPAPDDPRRDLILLRLADEIEDRLDGGQRYSQQSTRATAPLIELARVLDEVVLADLLVAVDQDADTIEPGLIRADHGTPFVTPRSLHRRPGAVLGGFHQQARRKLGPLLRRVTPTRRQRAGGR
jgi:hypothetical protein